MAKGCERAPGDGNFTCVVPAEGFSSSRRLDVHVSWEGCWEASGRTRAHGEQSGCVHLWDY